MNKDKDLDFYIYSAVGKVLYNLRTEKGYSLEQLGEKIKPKINKQTLSRYERAVMRMTVQTFKSICKGLDEDPIKVWSQVNDLYSSVKYDKSIK